MFERRISLDQLEESTRRILPPTSSTLKETERGETELEWDD